MTAKMWGNGYRATMICIDSYDKSIPVGRFYNQFCQDEISFHGTICAGLLVLLCGRAASYRRKLMNEWR